MRENLIDAVADRLGVPQKELLEKDMILHEILYRLCDDEYFLENYVFKGGTCLVKSYIGYHRFSEDLDFTWRDQPAFEGKSRKEIYNRASSEAGKLGGMLEKIADEFDLEFKNDQKDTGYFQFGGGGKMLTVFVWYRSEIESRRSMIKIQVNFLEKIHYGTERRKLSGMISGDESLKLVFGNHPYLEEIQCLAYRPEEILCEKIRAIMTRRGIKARDFLDIFLICEKIGIRLPDVAENAVSKINYSAKMNKRHRNNLEGKAESLKSGELFAWEDEENRLLLADIDKEGFMAFKGELEAFLQESIVPNLKRD